MITRAVYIQQRGYTKTEKINLWKEKPIPIIKLIPTNTPKC